MRGLLSRYVNSSPFIIFLPFLAVFVVLVLKLHNDAMYGDEERYYQFALNLLNGFYSPPPPKINLWNGPGYPIFLLPHVVLKLPLVSITISNAILQYLSIVLLFAALRSYTTRNVALFFSFFWACYYISYQEMPFISTEPLTSFLSTLILFFVAKLFKGDTHEKRYVFLLGAAIGFLVLTKIIFGYVLLFLLAAFSLAWVVTRTLNSKVFFALLIALAFNVPYLAYTYGLTGKLLYWGNSGGMQLYWMSTPVEGEFGDWNHVDFKANCRNNIMDTCNDYLFAKNHQKDMDYVLQFVGVEQDEAFKRIALQNIRNHPAKYFRNCISNMGRLFFGIPYSYIYQREQTLWRIPPNCVIAVLFMFCSVITAMNFRNGIPDELKLILGLLLAYLFLSTLVSAYPRQLYVVVPFFLFWFAFIIQHSVSISFAMKKNVDAGQKSSTGNLP